ncbi:hypothetical protein J2X04_000707 [Lysobacter niabensis]|uniref:Uncharacterized protein n=1 Tax=Agrilutibacter niabensis TaxID=380628 RepID=A0ABU1VM01_9GAMM|nr:hypothetical protein [Lysobacter niabensis]
MNLHVSPEQRFRRWVYGSLTLCAIAFLYFVMANLNIPVSPEARSMQVVTHLVLNRFSATGLMASWPWPNPNVCLGSEADAGTVRQSRHPRMSANGHKRPFAHAWIKPSHEAGSA